MKEEEQIVQTFVEKINQITDDNVFVSNSTDFSEERAPYTVTVRMTGVENINPLLPDYRMHLKILIDFYIADDEGGYKFNKTKETICNWVEEYLLNKQKLPELDEAIVGLFLEGQDNGLTQTSNQTALRLQVITSY